MKNILIVAILSLASGGTVAMASGREIPLTETTMALEQARNYEFRQVAGRPALCLDGVALVRDDNLRAGAVAVDVAVTGQRQFANVIFRARDAANYEEAYLRLAKSGFPDAVQYTPVLNGETNWQLFPHHQIAADFDQGGWVTLRVDFAGDRASVTVKGQKESRLAIDDLVLDSKGSGIGLASLNGACFSNFRIMDTPVLPPVSASAPPEAVPGTIRIWSLSPSAPFDGFALRAPEPASDWSIAQTEPSGLLLVSRHRAKAVSAAFERNSVDLVHAGVNLHSDRARIVALEFDVSDQARVYLNGEAIHELDNSFRAKGPLFRGDFDPRRQRLFLPLTSGDNRLVFGLAERANGWGLAARLIEAEGVEVRPLGL